MSDERGALQELCDISRNGGTGEFLCLTASVELGVYLQHGRVAWATVSTHPFEFARFLERRFGIDGETFRGFVARCRRERLPLGETLVASELLALDDVKAALRHQISLALAALAATPPGRTVFLQRRRFTEYSEAFTFDLPGLLPPARVAPPPLDEAGAAASTDEEAERLRGAIPGAVWVELLEGGRLVEAAPFAATRRTPSTIAHSTLAGGADFVALRSGGGTLVATRRGGPVRSACCGLAAGANFGAALSALSALGLMGASLVDGSVSGSTSRPWDLGEHDAGADELRRLLDYGREVLAAIVLAPDGEVVSAIGRERLPPDRALALLRRRLGLFATPAFSADAASEEHEPRPDAPAHLPRTLVAGDPAFWCFGAERFDGGDRTAWIVTDRRAPQGLGWACVAALGRGGLRTRSRGGRAS